MSLLRTTARVALSSMFVTGGLDALLKPAPKVPAVEDVAPKVAASLPGVPAEDTELLIQINGAVQVAAGGLLALGYFPRTSALLLAGTLVPATLAGHRFWEQDDASQRQQQQIHFLKNVSMFGGLLLAGLDTEGQPGIAWRTRHAVGHAQAALGRTRRNARLAAKAARLATRDKLAA